MALTDNLVSYYKFNENTGTSLGDSVGSNTGTITNATRTTGKIDTCLSFDGNGDYVDLGNTFNYAYNTSFSICFWYKTTNTANEKLIIARAGGSSGQFQYRVNVINNQVSFSVGTNTNTMKGSNLCDGNRHHYACVNNGSEARVYVDATDLGTCTRGTDTYSTNVYLGQRSDGYGDLFGELDELGVWNRALSSTEVTSLYNAGAGLQYPFTVTTFIPQIIML